MEELSGQLQRGLQAEETGRQAAAREVLEQQAALARQLDAVLRMLDRLNQCPTETDMAGSGEGAEEDVDGALEDAVRELLDGNQRVVSCLNKLQATKRRVDVLTNKIRSLVHSVDALEAQVVETIMKERRLEKRLQRRKDSLRVEEGQAAPVPALAPVPVTAEAAHRSDTEEAGSASGVPDEDSVPRELGGGAVDHQQLQQQEHESLLQQQSATGLGSASAVACADASASAAEGALLDGSRDLITVSSQSELDESIEEDDDMYEDEDGEGEGEGEGGVNPGRSEDVAGAVSQREGSNSDAQRGSDADVYRMVGMGMQPAPTTTSATEEEESDMDII